MLFYWPLYTNEIALSSCPKGSDRSGFGLYALSDAWAIHGSDPNAFLRWGEGTAASGIMEYTLREEKG